MNRNCLELSLEQELQVRIVELSSTYLSREQLEALIIRFTCQRMIQENMIHQLMKDKLFTRINADLQNIDV